MLVGNPNVGFLGSGRLGNGSGLIVGIQGTAGVYSTDNGDTWNNTAAITSGNYQNMAWNGTAFVATDSNASGNVIRSTDGINFSDVAAAETRRYDGISWNGTDFCAVSSSASKAQTSPTGAASSWTARNTNAALYGIGYNGSVFAGVAFGSTTGGTSPDGVTWTGRTTAASRSWNPQIAWNGSQFCCSASDSTNKTMTSPDGITWTERTLASTKIWLKVVAGNGRFVMSNLSDQVINWSDDGITWNAVNTGLTSGVGALVWNGSVFCAFTNSTGLQKAAVSADGTSWSLKNLSQAIAPQAGAAMWREYGTY